MNLSDTLKQAIEEHLAAPEKEQNTSRIDSAYWAFIADSFAECVRYKKDLHAVITDMKDLIDFGLCPEMLKNGEVVKAAIKPSITPSEYIRITVLSSFIEDRLNTILQETSRERIEKEIAIAERERSRQEKELLSLQDARKELLFSVFNASPKTGTIVEHLGTVDELQFSSLTMKKTVVKGSYVTPDKKRDHFTREKSIADLQGKIDRFLSSDPNQKANADQIRQQSADIMIAIEKIIDQNAGIA